MKNVALLELLHLFENVLYVYSIDQHAAIKASAKYATGIF